MLRLLFLASLATTIKSTEIKLRIGMPPNPMPGFSTNGYMGRWYMQFRKAPASCPGSAFFTDFEQNVMPEGKATLLSHLTWRSGGLCNSVTERLFIKAPGVFKMVDNNGDTISGHLMVVAMDYKNFVIHWGCTKMSASGKTCEDPWLSIGTRLRVPPKGVVATIENILRSRFGVTIGELTKVPHAMPCLSKLPKACPRYY